MKPSKKLARQQRNAGAKVLRAKAAKNLMIQLGKALVKKETPKVDENGIAVKDEAGQPVMEGSYDLPPYVETTADGSVKPIHFDYRPRISRLTWLNGKVYKQSGGARKNRPGESILHKEAIVEDASRSFTREVDKALAPEVPVVPVDAAQEAATL